jgi:hypothetical protein
LLLLSLGLHKGIAWSEDSSTRKAINKKRAKAYSVLSVEVLLPLLLRGNSSLGLLPCHFVSVSMGSIGLARGDDLQNLPHAVGDLIVEVQRIAQLLPTGSLLGPDAGGCCRGKESSHTLAYQEQTGHVVTSCICTLGVVGAALVPEGTESVLEQVELVVPDDLGASLTSHAPVVLLSSTVGDLVQRANLGLAKGELK